MTGTIVRPEEYTVLRQMDEAYTYALCKERIEQRKRQQQQKK